MNDYWEIVLRSIMKQELSTGVLQVRRQSVSSSMPTHIAWTFMRFSIIDIRHVPT